MDEGKVWLTVLRRKYPFAERIAGDAVFFGGSCDCNDASSIYHVGLMMYVLSLSLEPPHYSNRSVVGMLMRLSTEGTLAIGSGMHPTTVSTKFKRTVSLVLATSHVLMSFVSQLEQGMARLSILV